MRKKGDDRLKWLKYYRDKSGLSMNKLAEMLGVQLNTIWRWENERASPSVEMAKTLAQIFGISESELLNGPDTQKWELRLVMRKAGDPQEGVIDMGKAKSNAALFIEDDTMAITLSAGYALWEDDGEFEELINQLRRKRAIGLKTRKEDW